MSIYCFLDTETTGFSADYNDLIQIAAIIYDTDTKEEIETFDEYIKPREPIPKNITELTGITNLQVKDAPPIWEVLPMFWKWCEKYNVDTLLAHNAAFDMRFLDGKSKLLKIPHKEYNVIDTMKIARDLKKKKIFAFEKVNQPYLADFFGINYQAHNALEDVRTLIKLYYKFAEFDF